MRHAAATVMSSLLVVCALAAPALAQGMGQPAEDYRDKLYIACSFVFIAIIVFLILSHRRMRRTADDVKLLESRVAGLESASS